MWVGVQRGHENTPLAGGADGLNSDPLASLQVQRGWKRRSGKKRLNSIMMPAVRKNQIAAKTGAVVRNFFMMVEGMELRGAVSGAACQRGETVMRSADSVSALLVSSLKAASGQLAAAMVLLSASGTSIWISFMVASLLPRIAIR